MRYAPRRSWLLALPFALLACGDDPSSQSDASEATDTVSDGSSDSGPDAPDETREDTAPETTADTEQDTAPETIADTTPETSEDTVADTAPETIEDTVADTIEDTVADTTPDETIEDTVADTAPDTIEDTVADTTPETSEDTSEDGGEDAASETDEEIVEPMPQVAISGPDGPLDPNGIDDAGEQPVGVPFARSYTIVNDGDAPLKVSGVTLLKAVPLNCEQELSTPPDPVVEAGQATTFEVTSTVLDEGPASCPFTVATDDPDHPSFSIEITATGVASGPVVKKAASATCGATAGFGILVATLADFTEDGTLVTTNTPIDNCWLTTQVGTLPGGTTVNNAADSASCGALSCTESGELCRAVGAVPAAAGAPVTVSMTDTLLGGTVSHDFPKAPGTLTRSSVGASVSRGAPLTLTTSGGLADTLTLVTIQQDNDDGQTTVICEFPAESPSVTIPTNILAHFHDGPFNLLVDTRVQAFSVHNGYDVVLVVVNSTLPQQSSFVP